jgi:hypothetical protein
MRAHKEWWKRTGGTEGSACPERAPPVSTPQHSYIRRANKQPTKQQTNRRTSEQQTTGTGNKYQSTHDHNSTALHCDSDKGREQAVRLRSAACTPRHCWRLCDRRIGPDVHNAMDHIVHSPPQ